LTNERDFERWMAKDAECAALKADRDRLREAILVSLRLEEDHYAEIAMPQIKEILTAALGGTEMGDDTMKPDATYTQDVSEADRAELASVVASLDEIAALLGRVNVMREALAEIEDGGAQQGWTGTMCAERASLALHDEDDDVDWPID
jgi:hypothetical protein